MQFKASYKLILAIMGKELHRKTNCVIKVNGHHSAHSRENKATSSTIPKKKYKTAIQLHWTPHWVFWMLYVACDTWYIFTDCIELAQIEN